MPARIDYSWFHKPLIDYLGNGVDGDVYAIGDDRVVKFSKHAFDATCLLRLKANTPQQLATVYDYGLHVALDLLDTYWVEMERLNSLTEDEAKVFHSVLSHEDANKVKEFSADKLSGMLDGLAFGLEFDKQKVFDFCAAVQAAGFIQDDAHPRNIMRAKDGRFKFVDLDRLRLKSKPTEQ